MFIWLALGRRLPGYRDFDWYTLYDLELDVAAHRTFEFIGMWTVGAFLFRLFMQGVAGKISKKDDGGLRD